MFSIQTFSFLSLIVMSMRFACIVRSVAIVKPQRLVTSASSTIDLGWCSYQLAAVLSRSDDRSSTADIHLNCQDSFVLIVCEYWASCDKVINSFNMLIIEPTFWVLTIMQDMSLVNACKQKNKPLSLILTSWTTIATGEMRIDLHQHFLFGEVTG